MRNLVAPRIRGTTRIDLLNASLSVRGPDGIAQRTLTGPEDLRGVPETQIGIALPVPAADIRARLPAEPPARWP